MVLTKSLPTATFYFLLSKMRLLNLYAHLEGEPQPRGHGTATTPPALASRSPCRAASSHSSYNRVKEYPSGPTSSGNDTPLN